MSDHGNPQPNHIGLTPDLDRTEAEARIAKTRLEIGALNRQSSPFSKTLAALQSISAAVALFALAWTIYYNTQELRKSRHSENLDRAGTAVVKLGSQYSTERMAGLALLKESLEPGSEETHAVAMSALVNSISVESDSSVRTAMLDVFSQLNANSSDKPLLLNSLKALIRRNKALALSLEKTHDLSAIDPEDILVAPLRATANAAAILLKKGVTVSDLSDTYLGLTDLSDVQIEHANFDRSILRDADLSHTRLSQSSFVAACLFGTSFRGASLRNARFSDEQSPNSIIHWVRTYGDDTLLLKQPRAPNPPDFTSADLTNTSFKTFVLLGFFRQPKDGSASAWVPIFKDATVNGSDFRRALAFGVLDNPTKKREPFPFSPCELCVFSMTEAMNKTGVSLAVIYLDDNFGFPTSAAGFERQGFGILASLSSAQDIHAAKFPNHLANMLKQKYVSPFMPVPGNNPEEKTLFEVLQTR